MARMSENADSRNTQTPVFSTVSGSFWLPKKAPKAFEPIPKTSVWPQTLLKDGDNTQDTHPHATKPAKPKKRIALQRPTFFDRTMASGTWRAWGREARRHKTRCVRQVRHHYVYHVRPTHLKNIPGRAHNTTKKSHERAKARQFRPQGDTRKSAVIEHSFFQQ